MGTGNSNDLVWDFTDEEKMAVHLAAIATLDVGWLSHTTVLTYHTTKLLELDLRRDIQARVVDALGEIVATRMEARDGHSNNVASFLKGVAEVFLDRVDCQTRGEANPGSGLWPRDKVMAGASRSPAVAEGHLAATLPPQREDGLDGVYGSPAIDTPGPKPASHRPAWRMPNEFVLGTDNPYEGS